MCSGIISFSLNGDDMGVAFTDVDTSLQWAPAVSLSSGQQVNVYLESLVTLLGPSIIQRNFPALQALAQCSSIARATG